MRHKPIPQLLRLLRTIPIARRSRKAVHEPAFSADSPRIDDLLNARSVIIECGANRIDTQAESKSAGEEPAFSPWKPALAIHERGGTFIEPFLVAPSECQTSAVVTNAGWQDSEVRSRKESRRLRLLDRAISEIARDRPSRG